MDALCINQDSVTERNHQVQQMGDIYSDATLVHAWLGDDLQIASLLRFIAANRMADVDVDRMDKWGEDSLQLQNEVDRFVGNDYWKRALITQELLLPKRVFLRANRESVNLALFGPRVTGNIEGLSVIDLDCWWKTLMVLHRQNEPLQLVENM